MKTQLLTQIQQGRWDFTQLERQVWEALVQTFRELLVEILEAADKELAALRDAQRYQLKARHERKLESLVGSVGFRQRYDWDREDGRWVHLLDERLGLESGARVSPGLSTLAVQWATQGPSYRHARDRLQQAYGAQRLSHEAIRQRVHTVAEQAPPSATVEPQPDAPKSSPRVLFIEVDGHWSACQGQGSRRRRESKLAVLHEGWEPRQGRGSRADYRLRQPQYVSSMADAETTWEQVREAAADRFEDIDELLVIINGDEAPWIRQGVEHFGRALYQVDRFHLQRRLKSELRHDPARCQRALDAVRRDDVGTLLETVTEAWTEARDPETADRLHRLKESLLAHDEALRDYRVRLREAGIAVDSTWRGLGAAEANVDRFKDRTAKRGRSWSKTGLQAILTCLGRWYEGRLAEATQRALPGPETAAEAPLGGAGMLTAEPRSGPPIRQAGFPALQRGSAGFAPVFRQLLRPDTG